MNFGPSDATVDLLSISLQTAVPLWVAQLERQPKERVVSRAPDLGQLIAEKGDIIQFKSKKKGETAAAFNGLAEALAVLSFVPGGVRFLGMHFESVHPEDRWDAL